MSAAPDTVFDTVSDTLLTEAVPRPRADEVRRPPPAGVESSGQAASTQERRRRFEATKLSKRLHRQVGQAIRAFNMIEPGDKVMVCVSGGKDSYALLDILLALRQRAPVPFDLVAVNLDQKQPGFPEHVLPQYLASRGVAFRIEQQDTYSIVKRLVPAGQTLCSLCSRLRRGILYRVADELGATKIALGHHRDDMVATLLMNMFFGARLKGMPPKLVSDDGRHVVIRPLAYVAEGDLERWAEHRRFPIIPCSLCGSQDNLQRSQIKQMLREWERRHPGRIDNMAGAMGRITLSHLMDRNLYPFTSLQPSGLADAKGDKAFDDDEPCVARGAERPLRMQQIGAADEEP
jgi:tRNA 2-thiocytidine biosynthesis protein TtcA